MQAGPQGCTWSRPLRKTAQSELYLFVVVSECLSYVVVSECQVLLGFSVANPLGRHKYKMPEGFNALMIEGGETLQQNLQ